MIVRMAEEHGIDLARSWMIGDILDDIQAGRGAGCRTILIDNGNEAEWLFSPDREPHYRARPGRRGSPDHRAGRKRGTGRTGPGRVMLPRIGRGRFATYFPRLA